MGKFIFNEDEFWDRLKAILEAEMPKHGSWDDFAAALDLDSSTLLKYRNKDINRFPSGRTIAKLSEITGHSPSYILFGKP